MAKTIDMNQPRSMAPARNKKMPVTTFIRDTFFGVYANTFTTKTVDMDFRKSGQIIAPMVAKNVGGINVDRKGFQTRTYEPPKVAPQRPLNPEILNDRLPGETIHTTMSPEERQDYYLQQDAQELDDSISRREELMCAELLANGIVNVKGYIDDKLENFQEDQVDYQFTNKVTLSETDAWDDAGSDKYNQLKSAAKTVMKAGYNPKIALFGQTAWDYLEKDDEFLKKLDNRRLEIGMIRPELMTVDGNGLKYLGDLPELGLQLWAYYAWYLDYDGELKPYFPLDHVTIAPEGIGEMLYGAITQVEDDKRFHTYEGARVPKYFVNQNDDEITFRLSSKPLPGPFDVDSWFTYDVLG